MKYFLILLLLTTHAFAHEKELRTVADEYAYAKFTSQKHHPWPFPLLSIGHNMQSYQNYGGNPYWHDGLDIRSEVDQPMYASAGGVVVNIENYQIGNPLYWEVAILDDDGFVWKYHHVDRKSIPAEILLAYQEGAKIPAGTFIGNVVRWKVRTFGEVFHHLHLLIVAKDGKYINPFLMMEPLGDTTAPIISQIGIAQNHKPLEGETEVSGRHALYLEASDLTLHDKFILPPHKISYKLNNEEEKTVWEFIHLPSGKNDIDFISDFYMKGTCGNYYCRKFYFNLNFKQDNPRSTFDLAPGTHKIEVFVEDLVGNRSTKLFQWEVL